MIGEEVIAKAVDAFLRVDFHYSSVLTFDQFLQKERSQPFYNAYARKLDLNAFRRHSCVNGIIGDVQDPRLEKNMEIVIQSLTGRKWTIKCTSATTIEQLKLETEGLTGVPVPEQRLIFAGHQLEDGRTFGDCNIIDQSTVGLVLRLHGGSTAPYYITNEFLCPRFDVDFTGVLDTELYARGGFTYKRPCGWNRVALNVLDKYEDNIWLGAHRARTRRTSVDEEWPVSYFGIGYHNSQSFATSGYLLSKGTRYPHGRGIYSTPEIDVAELYAQKIGHGTKQFLVVVQTRVNPRRSVRIPIPPSSTGVAGEYWVTPTQEDIRPYGICIKPLN